MEIKIRGVDPVIVKKIDELAKAHHMSRNQYLKRCLSKYAIVPDVAELDSKYANLVHVLVERLEQANDVIETNNILLEKLNDKTDL
ncbi:MAG: hypothetical protein J5979_07550 [Lachnospiraceae bacterium]|nr:hypothetical protein [Lachnospiraceae bacterium]